MSDQSHLLGYIEEPMPTYQADPRYFRTLNDAVLETIPIDDKYPPLCRSMFAVTGEDAAHGAYAGRRLIHFAGQIKYMHDGMSEWLDKFEELLRRLHWVHAEVLVINGYSGPPLALHYWVSKESIASYMSGSPRPATGWELHGGTIETKAAVGKELSLYLGETRELIKHAWES